MMSRKLAVVILAAGQGTRMKSERPKVLHPVAGMPMLSHVVRTASALKASPIIAVVGHGADVVTKTIEAPFLEFVHQEEQLGTGHALVCAKNSLIHFEGDLLLLCGDVPLLQPKTLENLVSHHKKLSANLTILTAELNDPTGYGRIIRGAIGVERIVEEKDAVPSERKIKEINTGIYLFNSPDVFKWLDNIENRNAQGEYYLTDVVAEARKSGNHVEALKVENTDEIMGINDRIQLSAADRLMRLRINDFHQQSGVTIIDPQTTYIEPDVKVGSDTILHPGVHLRGHTQIGTQCTVEPGVVVTDCQVGNHVHIKSGSVLSESHIGDACSIGPMAHLRPGTVLKGQNKIGNFVETKKAIIGEKSQASHLSYLGDAELGKNVNIGCGTITCNYDGVNKHQTVIEDDVFVGSDTQFVAPVSIGHGSLIAAGSTITKDVPADALAIARSDQKIVDGWAAQKRKKSTKKIK